jgi:L-Ala-D/L-Glu epimerase
MTTIQDVRTTRLSVRLHTPFVTALRRTETVETLVVRIVDADGAVGWGEAPSVWQVTGESLAGAEACVTGPLSAVLAGADPEDLVELCRRVRSAVVGNFGAKAAVDVALHDLVARRRGITLTRLLGGTADRVATDVTLAAATAETMGSDAVARVGDGFDTLKLKVGVDASQDVARVLAVRRAVGPEVALRVDANQGWSPREAVRIVSSLEEAGAGLELVEQPVPAADLDGMAWVRNRVSTPVMADESMFSVRDLLRVIHTGAADLVNVKLAKCGGLSVAGTLLEVATEHGVGTLVGSMMETHIGVGAAASLVAARSTSVTSDLDAGWWASSPPLRGGPEYDGATLVLADAPGLGIEGFAAEPSEPAVLP